MNAENSERFDYFEDLEAEITQWLQQYQLKWGGGFCFITPLSDTSAYLDVVYGAVKVQPTELWNFSNNRFHWMESIVAKNSLFMSQSLRIKEGSPALSLYSHIPGHAGPLFFIYSKQLALQLQRQRFFMLTRRFFFKCARNHS